MRSCSFWIDDRELGSQGLIPFRLTGLGEKLANAFSRRGGAKPLIQWVLNDTRKKNVDTLRQWCDSFCFNTFYGRSDKRIFLDGFLFAGGEMADIVGDADTRLRTLQTLALAGLISEQKSNLSDNNIAIISEETAGADITEQEMDELGGDSFVLLHFYNNQFLDGAEPFIAAAIYEMLSLSFNAIWSGLLDYVKDHGRTSLNNWAVSVVKQSNGYSFWETPLNSSSFLILESEEQLVRDLFAGIRRIENGMKLAIKVFSANKNAEVLVQISNIEFYSRIREEIFSEPDDTVKSLLAKLARILLNRHGKVSEL